MSGNANRQQQQQQQRRRRKRARPQLSDRCQPEADEGPTIGNSRSRSIRDATVDFQCQDDALAFLDKDGDAIADSKCVFESLLVLLEQRRSGGWTGRTKKWQSETLLNFTKKPLDSTMGRRRWRPFAERASGMRFTHLGTPISDAVLALDRTGSYVICLGSKDEEYACQGLALRFYGTWCFLETIHLMPQSE